MVLSLFCDWSPYDSEVRADGWSLEREETLPGVGSYRDHLEESRSRGEEERRQRVKLL